MQKALNKTEIWAIISMYSLKVNWNFLIIVSPVLMALLPLDSGATLSSSLHSLAYRRHYLFYFFFFFSSCGEAGNHKLEAKFCAYMVLLYINVCLLLGINCKYDLLNSMLIRNKTAQVNLIVDDRSETLFLKWKGYFWL